MGQKISAMPAATVMGAGDLIPIVQGGGNKAVTWANFFNSPGLTGITWILSGVAVQFDIAGNCVISSGSGAGVFLSCPAGGAVQIGNAGQIFIQPAAGQQGFYGWLSAVPGNWGGPGVPTDLSAAMDRVATAVSGLLGGPIP